MGNVIISPNIKRESVRIDPAGNIINPKTKEIVKPIEPEYIPPTPEPVAQPQAIEKPSKIEEIISNKIEAIINRKIEEALNKLI